MIYDKIPNSDIKVSKVCLGTMTFGEQTTEAEAHEQLDFALDHGVNFLDTAELYAVPSTKENNGKTEDYIGTWINKSGKRDKYIIATKVTGPTANREYIAPNLGFSKERIHHAIDRSLRRLQTDYVDLYQLHWPERNANMFGELGYTHNPDEQWTDNIAEVVGIMSDLVKSGKIRRWGLSNETPWGTMRFLDEARKAGSPRPVTMQNPYSLLNRSYEIGMAEVSHRQNIPLLAYSPLAMGMLSGKYHKGTDTPKDRLNKYTYFSRYNAPASLEATRQYLMIAEEHNLSLTQLALAFVNSRSFLLSNIFGATSLEQLEENIKSVDVLLDKEVIKKIDAVHSQISNPAP